MRPARKLGKAGGGGRFTSLCLAAENHDGSGSEVLLLVDAQLVNLGTIKSRRDKGIDVITGRILLLCLVGTRMGGPAKAQSGGIRRAKQRQKDADQDDKQTN